MLGNIFGVMECIGILGIGNHYFRIHILSNWWLGLMWLFVLIPLAFVCVSLNGGVEQKEN